MLGANVLVIVMTALCSSSSRADEEPARPPSKTVAFRVLSAEETKRFLEQVRGKLSGVKTLRAEFTQERRMAAFVDPLTAKGVCSFRAPDRIRWELTEPYRSALVYNRGKLAKFVFEDDRPRKLNPPSTEIMKEVLKFISLWLQGDFESSKEFFDLQIEHRGAYLIRLAPRSMDMKKTVRAIELTMNGDSKHIRKVTIQENRGDRIIITFRGEQRNVELDESLFALE